MDNYGLALKILRKKFSLTQTELAEKIGVSNHAVSKWENGVNQPDVTTLQTICKFLDITVDQFLRLASGESEDSVFSVEEKDKEVDENKKVDNKRKRLVLLISIISACVIAFTVGLIFLIRGLNNKNPKETVLNATQEELLADINGAIKLKNGINEYDYVGKLRYNDKTGAIVSFKIVIDKQNGEYKKYYVKHDAEDLDVYGDKNYLYVTTEYGEKLRLNKSAYDLSEYFEDIEELYSLEDITTITAKKKGNTYIYEFGLTDEFVKVELEDFYNSLNGVIITDCKVTFTKTAYSSSENVKIEFIYQGVEYEFTATRQLNSNSSFVFPDFTKYQEGVDVKTTLSDIEDVLDVTKNLNKYEKRLYVNNSEEFSISKTNLSGGKAVATTFEGNVYYYNGKIYGVTSNYNGTFNYYKPASFDEYFQTVTKYVSLKSLVALDFNVEENHVSTILIDENSTETTYSIYLTEDGIEYIKEKFDCYLYSSGTVKLVLVKQGEIFTKIEIVDDDGKSYLLEIKQTPTVTTPNLSNYSALFDGNNVIQGVKSTQVTQDEFCSETIVDKTTGDVYTFDNVTVRKYDKNHNLLLEFEVERPSPSWYNVTLLGIENSKLYYAVFYNRADFSSDNKVYYMDLTNGSCYSVESNYSYAQKPVAYVYGRIIYDSYYGGLQVSHTLTSEDFLYFDIADKLLFMDGYVNSEYYIGVYDFNSNTFRKEKYDDLISSDGYCGEGFYDEDEVYRTYASIGKTKTETEYLKVIDLSQNRYYEYDIDANWQIVKDTSKYTFTTHGVYEKATGNFVYFKRKAEYRFFNGGVHVWDSYLNFFLDDMNWYTFYYWYNN